MLRLCFVQLWFLMGSLVQDRVQKEETNDQNAFSFCVLFKDDKKKERKSFTFLSKRRMSLFDEERYKEEENNFIFSFSLFVLRGDLFSPTWQPLLDLQRSSKPPGGCRALIFQINGNEEEETSCEQSMQQKKKQFIVRESRWTTSNTISHSWLAFYNQFFFFHQGCDSKESENQQLHLWRFTECSLIQPKQPRTPLTRPLSAWLVPRLWPVCLPTC